MLEFDTTGKKGTNLTVPLTIRQAVRWRKYCHNRNKRPASELRGVALDVLDRRGVEEASDEECRKFRKQKGKRK